MSEPQAGEHITEIIRRAPMRWKVTIFVASQSGVREAHASCTVNAPCQFSAVATALAVELESVKASRWSEVQIMVEPELPGDGKPLTPEHIIARAQQREERRKQ